MKTAWDSHGFGMPRPPQFHGIHHLSGFLSAKRSKRLVSAAFARSLGYRSEGLLRVLKAGFIERHGALLLI